MKFVDGRTTVYKGEVVKYPTEMGLNEFLEFSYEWDYWRLEILKACKNRKRPILLVPHDGKE